MLRSLLLVFLLSLFSFGAQSHIYEDQVDSRLYEVYLQPSLFSGSSHDSLPTAVDAFFDTLVTLANTNQYSFSVNHASLGEDVLYDVIYDTSSGQLAAQGIELSFSVYNSMSYDGKLYVAGLAFESIDPELAYRANVNASSPYSVNQEFLLEMYPTSTLYRYDNEVNSAISNFAPSTLSDFGQFFTATTLSGLHIPLTTKLVTAEQEWERVIARTATLNQVQMTISIEFVYSSQAHLQANSKVVEVELMLYTQNHDPVFLTTAHQFLQLLAAQSFNNELVHGHRIRLYWLFVAVGATILVALIIGLYLYVRGKRAQNSSDERLFDERK